MSRFIQVFLPKETADKVSSIAQRKGIRIEEFCSGLIRDALVNHADEKNEEEIKKV